MKSNFLKLVVFVSILYSCNSSDINDIIIKYDTEKFTELKGYAVSFRSSGQSSNSAIYLVSEFDSKCSPYFVEINKDNYSIVTVNKDMLLKTCNKDYLDENKIASIMTEFFKYDLMVLQVDEEGNVYINPNNQELPVYLRKATNSTPKNLDQFKIYRDNWYIRK